jgi:hypothetical protein
MISAYQGEDGEQAAPRRLRWEAVGRVALVAWVVVVLLYFLWEMNGYRGLFAILSDAQDGAIGRSFPLATVLVLVLIFSSPIFLLLRTPRSPDEVALPQDLALAGARRFSRVLTGAAIGFGAAALALMLYALIVSGGGAGSPDGRMIDASAIDSANGPATVRGDIRFSISSTYSTDAILSRNEVRIVPITVPGDPSKRLRYFAEYAPSEVADSARDQANGQRAGRIMKGKVPASILALYRNGGYRVDGPTYLVGRSQALAGTPYWELSFVMLVGLVVALILASVQRRHVGRLVESRPVEAA